MFCLPALMEIAQNSEKLSTSWGQFPASEFIQPSGCLAWEQVQPITTKWKGSKTETSKLIYSRTHLTGNWLEFDVITPETINGCNWEKAYSIQG